MERSDHYKYAQQNLLLLNQQIDMVKKSAQEAIGKHTWQEENNYTIHQLEHSQREVLAATRLYTFLICSWLEARISKIFYENSSCAFTDSEINSIMYDGYGSNRQRKRTMEQIWKLSFSIAVQKSYGFPSHPGIDHDYSSEFPYGSLSRSNYQTIRSLFSDVADAITVRNRLAHGQWDIQFNSSNTEVAHYALLTQYDNIQKLGLLKDIFDQIGDIISMYVTYKDKRNPNFDNIIDKKVQIISDKKQKAQNMSYAKYTTCLKKAHAKEKLRRKVQS